MGVPVPFFFGLARRPAGDGLARLCIDRRDGFLASVVQFAPSPFEAALDLWRSPVLTPTRMDSRLMWNAAGDLLAATQFNELVIATPQHVVRSHRFAARISDALFDTDGTLWVASGTSVYRFAGDGVAETEPQCVGSDVAAIGMSNGRLVLARRGKAGLSVVAADGADGETFAVGGTEHARASFRTSPDGSLFLERSDFERFDAQRVSLFAAGDGRSVAFQMPGGIGMRSEPLQWQPVDADAIAVVAALDGCAGLWLLTFTGDRTRLSPATLEVENAYWNPDRSVVVVSGRSAAAPHLRRTLCLTRHGDVLHDVAGGTEQVTWSDNTRFSCLRETARAWTIAEASTRDFLARPAVTAFASVIPLPDRPAASIVLSDRAGVRRSEIIYVRGPHRHVPAGAESIFYHHALRSMLSGLPNMGLVGIQTAGHEDMTTAVAELAEAIDATCRVLRSRGAERLSIVATSLGVPAALRFLAQRTVEAAVLLNPVYTLDLPIFAGSHAAGRPRTTIAEVCTAIAPAIRTPLLIVHGLRDELSPSQHSSHFISELAAATPATYVSVPDEGHVFRSERAWNRLLQACRDFLLERGT